MLVTDHLLKLYFISFYLAKLLRITISVIRGIEVETFLFTPMSDETLFIKYKN